MKDISHTTALGMPCDCFQTLKTNERSSRPTALGRLYVPETQSQLNPLNPAAQLIHATIKPSAAFPSWGCAGGKNGHLLHWRDRRHQLCSVHIQYVQCIILAEGMRMCVCVLSINTVLPPTPLSLWLRQQKWKVLIIFPFIQTINPGAQCSRVPLWETSHIWQRQWCYHHSLLISGAPVIHLYPEAFTNTWTCVDTPIPFDTIWDYFFKAGTHFPKPAFVLNGILWAAFRSHFHHQ